MSCTVIPTGWGSSHECPRSVLTIIVKVKDMGEITLQPQGRHARGQHKESLLESPPSPAQAVTLSLREK